MEKNKKKKRERELTPKKDILLTLGTGMQK